MKLISRDICNKSLDFNPDKPWPEHWPSFAWENILISGFDRINQLVLNFSAEDMKFLDLFHSCHPQLNFSELGRIFLEWEREKIKQKHSEKSVFSWKEFFSMYDFQNTDFFIQQLRVFMSTPSSFRDWVNKKAVRISELRILNALKNMDQIHFIFQWIIERDVSHSTGVKALELGGELRLMGFSPDEILKQDISPEEVIRAMEKKRKPLSSSGDDIKQKHLKKIIWPREVTAQWSRRGDKTGLEMKIWCQNQTELEDRIKRIHQMAIFSQLAEK